MVTFILAMGVPCFTGVLVAHFIELWDLDGGITRRGKRNGSLQPLFSPLYFTSLALHPFTSPLQIRKWCVVVVWCFHTAGLASPIDTWGPQISHYDIVKELQLPVLR